MHAGLIFYDKHQRARSAGPRASRKSLGRDQAHQPPLMGVGRRKHGQGIIRSGEVRWMISRGKVIRDKSGRPERNTIELCERHYQQHANRQPPFNVERLDISAYFL